MPEGGSGRSAGMGFEVREILGEELVGGCERGYRRVVIAWTLEGVSCMEGRKVVGRATNP